MRMENRRQKTGNRKLVNSEFRPIFHIRFSVFCFRSSVSPRFTDAPARNSTLSARRGIGELHSFVVLLSRFVVTEEVYAEVHSLGRPGFSGLTLLQLEGARVELMQQLGGAAARQFLQLVDAFGGKMVVRDAALQE